LIDGHERLHKEVAVVYFKVLFQKSNGRTDVNFEKSQLLQKISRPTSESGVCQIRSTCEECSPAVGNIQILLIT
jgi:hypothetical protein